MNNSAIETECVHDVTGGKRVCAVIEIENGSVESLVRGYDYSLDEVENHRRAALDLIAEHLDLNGKFKGIQGARLPSSDTRMVWVFNELPKTFKSGRWVSIDQHRVGAHPRHNSSSLLCQKDSLEAVGGIDHCTRIHPSSQHDVRVLFMWAFKHLDCSDQLRKAKRSIYEQNGYADRDAYLESLCEEYDSQKVYALAELLGPNEDFDGLVTMLQDEEEGL